MIAPQAYRILGETMALAEVFPRPLGQLAKPLRPHERADVLCAPCGHTAGTAATSPVPQAALAVNRGTAHYRL